MKSDKNSYSGLPIGEAEFKRRLIFWRWKVCNTREESIDGPKSTKIRLWDIALLARVFLEDLKSFLRGKINLGKIKAGRVYRILLEVEQGLVTKSQYGVYHFHDTPQRPEIRVMQLNIATGRMQMVKQDAGITMPSFSKLLRD